MGQNPSWQANSPTGGSQISLISSTLNVHHHIFMSWTPSPTQIHTNIIQVPHNSMNFKFNIILIPMPRPAMGSLKLRVHHEIPIATLIASILSACHAHPTALDLKPQMTVGELCRPHSFSICILRLSTARCSHLNRNIPPLPLEYPHPRIPLSQFPRTSSPSLTHLNSVWFPYSFWLNVTHKFANYNSFI